MTPVVCSPSKEAWLLTEDKFNPNHAFHYESIFTLANGYAGVRGSLEMNTELGDAGFYVAGVFDQVHEFTHEIVDLPCWLGVGANMDGFNFDLRRGKILEYRRTLDMKQGLLFTHIVYRDAGMHTTRWESVRLMHMKHKHLAIEWGTIKPLDYSGTVQMTGSIDAWLPKHGSGSRRVRYGNIHAYDLDGKGVGLDVTTAKSGIEVAIASRMTVAGQEKRSAGADEDIVREQVAVKVEKNGVAAWEKRTVIRTCRDAGKPVEACRAELESFAATPLKKLLKEHTDAWAQIWDAADIEIEGDPRGQKALRFSEFHLASMVNPADEKVSLGAKGLHGSGYNGLVFWDTEIYLLPFYIYTNPAAARALLMYRFHFLEDARWNAQLLGYSGVRYPWNSSITGKERSWKGWQEHVNPDVAWGVDKYVAATDDQEFYLNYGAALIIETAAYWPSRVEFDVARGKYVINVLCGPDEIHTGINNNTFTNQLVKWHVARALTAIDDLKAAGKWEALNATMKLSDKDLAHWRDISDRMFVNYSEKMGFHEQYDGYFQKPERKIDRSLSRMQYTGPVQHSFYPTKVAQQADTVLMYYMFANDFPADMRRKAYKYYEPRCSHTSSLSRNVFAIVAAQTGLMDEAYRQFLESAETDLAHVGEADSGVHAACMGGNYQIATIGFGGLSVKEGLLSLEPRLPKKWKKLSFKALFHGKQIEVEVSPKAVRLRTHSGSLPVLVNGQVQKVTTTAKSFPLRK